MSDTLIPVGDDELASVLARSSKPTPPQISLEINDIVAGLMSTPTNSTPTTDNDPEDEQPDTPDPTPTEDNTKQLNDYAKAFEQEFKRANDKIANTHDEVKEVLAENGKMAAAMLVALAVGSRSDQVRYQSARFIVESIEKYNSGTDSDPFKDLVSWLTPAQTLVEPE